VIAIEGETRAVTAETDLLVGVVLVRGEGRALQLTLALLPAPGWQHFGRPHTIETKYQFKTISKLIFSVFDQVRSLAVYVFCNVQANEIIQNRIKGFLRVIADIKLNAPLRSP
jgi:hypothetical protein